MFETFHLLHSHFSSFSSARLFPGVLWSGSLCRRTELDARTGGETGREMKTASAPSILLLLLLLLLKFRTIQYALTRWVKEGTGGRARKMIDLIPLQPTLPQRLSSRFTYFFCPDYIRLKDERHLNFSSVCTCFCEGFHCILHNVSALVASTELSSLPLKFSLVRNWASGLRYRGDYLASEKSTGGCRLRRFITFILFT
jgi:hypothetical protein